MDALVGQLRAPGGRACLVAPPGAGKTRCALHVASELGLPLEVRVPTTALVEQWERRGHETLLSPTGDAPPLVVATYAAARPFAPGSLVVLDEAHHLLKRWADDVAGALCDGQRVLGLTATPPEGQAGFDRFLALVGTAPVEVQAPPLVRDGHLAPYQELVWPVLADTHELGELAEVDRGLDGLEATLQPHLGVWEAAQLAERLEELTEARFARNEGLLVALCRRVHARGRRLPADLPPDPELVAPPSLEDRAEVLAAYAAGTADPAPVHDVLRGLGFRISRAGVSLSDDIAWRSLSACGSRIAGCIGVLALEHRARGDGLRALVLTDRDVEGDRISARQVLKALVADPRTEVLDPILVTGSAFWIDDDMWPQLHDRLPPLPWVAAEDHHELDVSRWPTADRVALATRLLSEGITRCLVGTRHLLGEGWDCPPVNVAIDLTGIVAAVTVNQVRGRALRRDPADPSKVASLWEVLALAPGVAGGDRMLRRLQQRHEHTLGIDASGRIRGGVARIDPLLARDGDTVAAEAQRLQAHMRDRALDATAMARRWAVGTGYRDRRVWRVEGHGQPARVQAGPRQRADLLAAAPGAAAVLRRRTRTRATGAAAAAIVASLPLVTLGPVGWLAAIAISAVAVGLGAWVGLRAGREERFRRARLEALWSALHDQDPELPPLVVDRDRCWVDGSPEHSRRFAEAVAELLGPVRYPRYLLLEPDGRVWPVPAALGGNRSTADAFAQAWAAWVGPCVVRFARSGRGRELLEAAWRAGGTPSVELVEDWE